MENWYMTDEEVAQAIEEHRKQQEQVYVRNVEEYGEEAAREMGSDIFDAHCCSYFTQHGGECAICGELVYGSPAYYHVYGY